MEEQKAKCYDLISEIMQAQSELKQLEANLTAEYNEAKRKTDLRIANCQEQINEIEKGFK